MKLKKSIHNGQVIYTNTDRYEPTADDLWEAEKMKFFKDYKAGRKRLVIYSSGKNYNPYFIN